MFGRLSIVLLLWSAACGGKEAEQARLLLVAVEDLELEGPLMQRRQRIERLEGLPLSEAGLRATQAACVAAHSRLLEAEVLQAEVKQGLSQAQGAADPGQVGATRARLSGLLQQSEEARAQGQAALPTCRQRTRELAKRFR